MRHRFLPFVLILPLLLAGCDDIECGALSDVLDAADLAVATAQDLTDRACDLADDLCTPRPEGVSLDCTDAVKEACDFRQTVLDFATALRSSALATACATCAPGTIDGCNTAAATDAEPKSLGQLKLELTMVEDCNAGDAASCKWIELQ